MQRIFVERVGAFVGQEVRLKGWVYRYRAMAKTVFIVLRDCTGTVQIVADPKQLDTTALKLDDVIEVRGQVRAEPSRAARHQPASYGILLARS